MTSAWLGVIATLGGVLLGGLTTFATQERARTRESRRQLYAAFIGESRVWTDSLLRLIFTIRSGWEAPRREPYWELANSGKARVLSLRAQIDLLGTRATREAAYALEHHLLALSTTVFHCSETRTRPDEDHVYQQEFDQVLAGFIRVAARELRLARVRGPA
ncbi:hypothetical protein [Streptomyces sp. NPDC048172]|uniref:hypothetical protein n=1 Tax=Streptomyces sp. NPDC048172 TaxID=3365505 RepID=UPI00371049CF